MPLIQALDRALKILDLFDEYEPELKITDISERMGLHKSTVHSLLKTLQIHGYIDQNSENGKYKLGMKLFERGNCVINALDIRSIAKKHLQDLSMKTGQTTNLVILDGKEGVFIDKVEGNTGVIRYSRIGRRIPVHCSGVGKALVAFRPQEEVAKILEGYVYSKHTENTINNEAQFLQELERVRTDGYAVDDQENEPGVYCIAVPILNHQGWSEAAISVSSPILSMEQGASEKLLALLVQTAGDLSKQMGYGLRV